MFALLAVDVSESWEEEIAAFERGYRIEWEHIAPGRWVRSDLGGGSPYALSYPHGTLRAGLDAIIDTTRLAEMYRIPRYAVEFPGRDSDGEHQTCYALQPYIPKDSRYEKPNLSAFSAPAFADRLERDGCRQLMVIGYDRDDCVLATVEDAAKRGIEVVTSEHCMLTLDRSGRREKTLARFRELGSHLESLVDTWNFLLKRRSDG